MIISMTGYGRGSAKSASQQLIVEVKVLNGRFMDQKIRGLEISPGVELKIRDKVRKSLERGSVTVTISDESGTNGTGTPAFNRERFEALEKILINIQQEYGRQLNLSEIITSNDIFVENGNSELTEQAVFSALGKALSQVNKMRKQEGQTLEQDLRERLRELKNALGTIESAAKDNTDSLFTQMQQRLNSLAAELKLDQNRLYQEAALLADKYDIAEEVTRCYSHIEQFTDLLAAEEAVGKRLNFLIQEIGREVNTIGSKTNIATVVPNVIGMKDQLEKLREQVQNIL